MKCKSTVLSENGKWITRFIVWAARWLLSEAEVRAIRYTCSVGVLVLLRSSEELLLVALCLSAKTAFHLLQVSFLSLPLRFSWDVLCVAYYVECLFILLIGIRRHAVSNLGYSKARDVTVLFCNIGNVYFTSNIS